MLNALSVALAGRDEAGWQRAARSLQRQGFVATGTYAWPGGVITTWSCPGQREVPDQYVQTEDGMACCVGPLWYRGRFGVEALKVLLGDVRASGYVDEGALRGNFALFVHAGDPVWLLNDALGLVRVYASEDGCFFCTSWLANCAYLDRVELDEVAAIEYVLLGAVHSPGSVVRDIGSLPLGKAFDLGCRCTRSRFSIAAEAPGFGSLDEAVGSVAEHLRRVFAEIAHAFPGAVTAALSGGFDSRLIVAGLLAAGVHPHLFVYGSAASPDVAVAKVVADSMGIAIDVVDKDVINRGLPPPDVDSLEQSALFFDGLPTDGVYDPGADRQTRLQQTAGGSIALNGGGGEIFRNFFHLPDRAFTAADVVRSFYRGFSPKVFRDRAGLPRYQACLTASMQELPGIVAASDDKLARSQIELLYPLFRCHYWMAANNTVGVRHGYYATPLVDLESVRVARRVPLRWKNAGVFQSRLIAELQPDIAAQASAYGFDFVDGPGWKARLGERLNCARPVALRPLINATRRRLHKIQANEKTLKCYRTLLPGEWCLDPLLDLRQLPDDNALRRALSVEVVWRRLLRG